MSNSTTAETTTSPSRKSKAEVPGEIPSRSTFRSCLQLSADEVPLFGTDVCSQPHYDTWAVGNQELHLKCSRALPIAGADDIVLLTGPLYEPYLEWLHAHGFGPRKVVSYNAPDAKLPLALHIKENPEPVLRAVKESGRRPVYIPFYSSDRVNKLCASHGWELFGCEEETTLKYFDKGRFKSLCEELGVTVIEGKNFGSNPGYQPSMRNMERFLLRLLNSYPSLVVRGTLGSAGKSVYQVDESSLSEVVRAIEEDCGTEYLVEPFLRVISSPNDQWCVRRDGTPAIIGTSVQLFDGFKHRGNLYGQVLAPRVMKEIYDCSWKVVHEMARSGYRSVVGIDYVVSDIGVYPIENNSRLNGSTFAFGIVDLVQARIPQMQCWKFFKATVEPQGFESLLRLLESVVYDGARPNAVFPFDCDLLESKGIFEVLLLAEDLYHIDFLERRLAELGVVHQ